MVADRDPLPIGDVLGAPGSGFGGMERALETGRVWARWERIVGPEIARHAEPSSLKGGVLRVRADSPAWATEIGYLAAELRERINREVRTELVTEVRVWTGGGRSHRTATEASPAGPAPPRRAVPEDPMEALERARQAWERTPRSGRRGYRPGDAENGGKTC